jgi:hypothetical protein
MLLQSTESTKPQSRQQRERGEKFAARTAEVIGAAGQCLFSLLPYEERCRQAASWYEACAQATLRGNYAPLDEWIRSQACKAAEEHFALEDLLELLRICRRSAIEVERWNEDIFSAVDDVINEGLLAIRAQVPWNISEDLNYLQEAESDPAPQPGVSAPEPTAGVEIREGERRVSGRNRLALPIRVCGNTPQGQIEEITRTENVSLGGLYFKTRENYREDSPLLVTYPYWTDPGSINKEYPAQVARLDRLPDKTWGVAVEFLQNLSEKTS